MLDYVQDVGLKFRGGRTKRALTEGIVLHHRAGWGDVESEHADSIARGWIGIGYNYYIRQDGTVWLGRGEEYVGAHAGRKAGAPGYADGAHNNSRTIGIGFEGYYHPGHKNADKTMPQAQYEAGVRLMRDLRIKYPGIKWIKGHREMPGCSTACPGDYFPLARMAADGMAPASGGTGGGKDPAGDAAPAYNRLLKLTSPNMQGDDVEAVQRALIAAGADIAADGVFGPATERAVRRYQKARGGLAADGQVGPKTWAALMGGKASGGTGNGSGNKTENGNTAGSEGTAGAGSGAKVTLSRLLKLASPNMRGSDVRGVQELLRATGAKIEVDGIFGPNTERAVKRYQNAKGGLTVDGIVGRDTITALGGAWKG